jgi:hypothetical protein
MQHADPLESGASAHERFEWRSGLDADEPQAGILPSMRTALALEVGSPNRAGGAVRRVLAASAASPPDRDYAFIELLNAFRPHGGLMRGDDLAELLVRRRRGDHAGLARMIVAGRMISFAWNHDYWVPVFQLDGYSLDVRRGPEAAMAQLCGVFDGWDAAVWFATPNPWLHDQTPLDLVDADADAVVNAARIARFLLKG